MRTIEEIKKIAEPGRCVNCDSKIKKTELQCKYCKRDKPLKK